MEVNEYQIGGNHYSKMSYQHWDFAIDADLNCIIYGATKYPSRWRDKDGLKDLRKALHFISKAVDEGIIQDGFPQRYLDIFTAQLHPQDASIVQDIIIGDYEAAQWAIENIIKLGEVSDEESEDLPRSYVNPDADQYPSTQELYPGNGL